MLTFALVISLAIVLVSEIASAADLLDAKVSVGSTTVLEGTSKMVRIEQPRVNALAMPTFFVPEPAVLVQLSPALLFLAMLHAYRRRVAACASGFQSGRTQSLFAITEG
jgi:hypothetical protein